jgi:hypothetical protein
MRQTSRSLDIPSLVRLSIPLVRLKLRYWEVQPDLRKSIAVYSFYFAEMPIILLS